MEILQLAGRDETPEKARWALYSIIIIFIYANEYGQPKSQDMADGDPVSILYLYTILIAVNWEIISI